MKLKLCFLFSHADYSGSQYLCCYLDVRQGAGTCFRFCCCFPCVVAQHPSQGRSDPRSWPGPGSVCRPRRRGRRGSPWEQRRTRFQPPAPLKRSKEQSVAEKGTSLPTAAWEGTGPLPHAPRPGPHRHPLPPLPGGLTALAGRRSKLCGGALGAPRLPLWYPRWGAGELLPLPLPLLSAGGDGTKSRDVAEPAGEAAGPGRGEQPLRPRLPLCQPAVGLPLPGGEEGVGRSCRRHPGCPPGLWDSAAWSLPAALVLGAAGGAAGVARKRCRQGPGPLAPPAAGRRDGSPVSGSGVRLGRL